MDESKVRRRRLPPAWLIALALIGLYWLALGRRHAEHISENPTEALPLLFAGLCLVAAIGLLTAGRSGRIIAALVAAAGVAWALVTVGFIVVTIVTRPDATNTSPNAWGFLAIYLGIAAGYGLVLRRAIRGRAT